MGYMDKWRLLYFLTCVSPLFVFFLIPGEGMFAVYLYDLAESVSTAVPMIDKWSSCSAMTEVSRVGFSYTWLVVPLGILIIWLGNFQDIRGKDSGKLQLARYEFNKKPGVFFLGLFLLLGLPILFVFLGPNSSCSFGSTRFNVAIFDVITNSRLGMGGVSCVIVYFVSYSIGMSFRFLVIIKSYF